AVAPECLVYGVEPLAGNDGQQSFNKGEIVRIPQPRSIADGALTQALGEITFPIIKRYAHDILTVPDEKLISAMQFFAERMKLVVEPTGCLGAAAVLHETVPVRGMRVGVILSGGNVDLASYAACLAQGTGRRTRRVGFALEARSARHRFEGQAYAFGHFHARRQGFQGLLGFSA